MGEIRKRGRIWWIRYCRGGRRYEESSRSDKYEAPRDLLRMREGDIAKGEPVTSEPSRFKFDDAATDIENEYRQQAPIPPRTTASDQASPETVFRWPPTRDYYDHRCSRLHTLATRCGRLGWRDLPVGVSSEWQADKELPQGWSDACEAAGVPGRIPHDFRRLSESRAGRCLRRVAMQLTGHLTESVYRRYAIVSEADLGAGVEKLAELANGTIRGTKSRKGRVRKFRGKT